MVETSTTRADATHAKTVRVLGTGGTIAGTGSVGAPDNAYKAGQLAVEALLAPLLPSLGDRIKRVQALQVAQLDSRNMGHGVWQQLAAELQRGQDDPGVVGQVVTHGTDTLEETAVFLQGVLRGHKPVVLTAAMRPATSAQADGPDNLRRALFLAADPAARGVLMAFGGQVWPAVQVRKVHPFALEAFVGGDGEVLAQWVEGAWAWKAGMPKEGAAPEGIAESMPHHPVTMPDDPADWPRVEIVHSHAGADGRLVDALLEERSAASISRDAQPRPSAPAGGEPPVRGLVISATGNGSIHDSLHHALQRAVDRGRLSRSGILVATRCTKGWIVGDPEHGWPVAHCLTPAQARVALMLLLAATTVQTAQTGQTSQTT